METLKLHFIFMQSFILIHQVVSEKNVGKLQVELLLKVDAV